MTTKSELLRVIRKQCTSCMGDVPSEVTKSTSPKCSLFDFRFGKDPRPNPGKVEMGKRQGYKNLSNDSQGGQKSNENQ